MSDAPHYLMYVDGKWLDAGEFTEVRNPANDEVVATVARGGLAEVDAAVAAAKAAHERGEWRGLPPAGRAAIMQRMADHMAERIDELTALQVRENGATVRAAGTFLVGYSIAHLRYFAGLAADYAFERPGPLLKAPTTAAGLIRREPIGVVGAVVPWNFPLLLAMWKIGPALAAGNTIVVKPDEKTPLLVLELCRAAEAAGLPRGVLNVVNGPGSVVGARLAEHPDVRKIAFTGSTEVGKRIMQAAAGNVKRVTLELGGKGANIVLDDADIALAVDGALFACLLMAGQACESGTRLLLPDSLHDEFVTRLVERISTLTIGDPMRPETDLGPVISDQQKRRVEGYIQTGIDEGATVAYRGQVPDDPELAGGHWVAPVIFTGVTNDMTIAREEIFGPVLSVLRYRNDDEAVALANDSEYGLSAGVWGRNKARALAVASRLEAGTVWINDWHMVNCLFPFGGYKQSGLGRELGPTSLDEYTETKFVHIDLTDGTPADHAFAIVVGASAR